MKSILIIFTLLLAGFLILREAQSESVPRQQVGALPNGGFLLNSGWTLRPAGKQVPVDTLPMSSALSNDGKYLLVLNAGYNPPTVSVIDIAQRKEVGRTRLADAWLGLAVAPKGNVVYVGGGTRGIIYELGLDLQTGSLTRLRELPAVADLGAKGLTFIGDVAVSADGRVLYAADVHMDAISVLDLKTGKLITRWKGPKRPYRLLIAPNGKTLFVTGWGSASVTQLDAATGAQIGFTRVAAHPTDMLWLNRPPPAEGSNETPYAARLFVAAANTNNVYSFGVTADTGLKLLETINLSMTPMQPLGMTPSALAIDKAGHRLYVACSDGNAIAVVDISEAGSHLLGFIPTGWYPTAVRVLDDNTLVMLNGKGLGSRANPDGPNPTVRATPLYEGAPSQSAGYVGHIQTGTVAFLEPFEDDKLQDFSRTVAENSPYRDELIHSPSPDEQTARFSAAEGRTPPIRHIIYIIKENRTYDQVLGDLEKGNGDKSLNLFGQQVTPNLHELARQFILYDNFYENADVSADGHNWASAAIAPDYTQKLWPNSYARRRKTYDYEGGEPANTPPAGYLWDNALQAGLTVRNYGEWAENIPLRGVTGPRQVAKLKDPALIPYTDMNYRGFDLDYPDVDRVKELLREWKEFESKGEAPQLSVVRLGNDHTSGTAAGKLTPLSFAADNDYAVGQLVDAVSHGRLWASTAIFVIEDDAQNGPDHVDSHRAPAWVVSPYTHRGIVDSTMYNQTSILRTIELIIGLRPMTQFDAAARPMLASFAAEPDLRPYSVIAPKTSLTDRNPGEAVGAAESARMDFSEADRADDDELNDVLWRAIKKTDPPAPTRSLFGR